MRSYLPQQILYVNLFSYQRPSFTPSGERVLFRSEAVAQAYGAAFIARISAAISRLSEATARL